VPIIVAHDADREWPISVDVGLRMRRLKCLQMALLERATYSAG